MENEEQQQQLEEAQEQEQQPTLDVDSYFKSSYGISLAEAEAKYNEAILKASLAEAWDISPKEAMKRLELVIEKISALPEEEQQKYNSIDGVVNYWSAMSAPQPTPVTAPTVAPLSFKPQRQQTKPASAFTKEEIANDIAAYQAAIFEELRREGLI